MRENMEKSGRIVILTIAIMCHYLFAGKAPGKVAYWNFDEAAGTVLLDNSGNTNNGTIVGALWTQGISGTALNFDGINDQAEVPDHATLDNTGGVTVEAWIKLAAESGDHQVIIAKWYDDSYHSYQTTASFVLEVYPNTRKVQLVLSLSTGRVDIQAKDDIPLNQWTYIVGTCDGTTGKIYINGALSNELPASGLVVAGTSPVMIGAHDHSYDTNRFKGVIDEISLYGYALSADTITAHYESLRPDTSKVIAKWNFNEGTGAVLNDVSGNANNGAVIGPIWTQGVSGTALYFDGSNDWVKVPDNPTLDVTKGITIETWVKLARVSNDHQVIIAKWYDDSYHSYQTTASYVVEIYPNTRTAQLVLSLSTGRVDIQAIDEITVNEWTQITGTFDGTVGRIYINGKLSNEKAANGSLVAGTSPVMIGAHDHISDTNLFNGSIDEITLYNYALDPTTIQAHYEEIIIPPDEINIGMQTHYVQPGDELWVPVYITNYKDNYTISAIQFSLSFDTTIVEYLEASVDSGLASAWQYAINPLGDSVVIALGGVTQELGYGEGELIRCKFKVKSTASTGSFSDIIISDVDIDEGSGIIPTTTPGKIIVDIISILYGDVSGNNMVTAYDGAGIVQYVVGQLVLPDNNFPNFTTQVADVSGDGTVTSYDAALVFQYSVGLLEKFPVESYRTARTRGKTGDFDNAAFRLVKSSASTATTVYYNLLAKNIEGAISSDIRFKYDPAKVLVELGGTITTSEPVNIESSLDIVSKVITISITTTDDFDAENEMHLATIEVPVQDTNSLQGGLLFLDALLNEESVRYLDPSMPTGIAMHNNNTVIPRNCIAVNKQGLVIKNFEKKTGIITLYDLQGRLILSKQFNITDDIININMHTLAPNFYIYRIKMGSEIITRSFNKFR